MKSRDYIGVIRGSLIPILTQECRDGYIFKQDNARVDVSSDTLDWFDAQNIRVLPWPACSPGLNPVENLWDILVRTVYAENRCYNNDGEITAAAFQAWANIDQNTITRLITAMPNRIFELIEKKGKAISY
uniref:Tc1-like transposase DDE domain-containing protein n=1 Tax=Phlebotomus papatasi TaxID=29031 RepID=A0A1B0D7Z1_PHLPP